VGNGSEVQKKEANKYEGCIIIMSIKEVFYALLIIIWNWSSYCLYCLCTETIWGAHFIFVVDILCYWFFLPVILSGLQHKETSPEPKINSEVVLGSE